MRYQMVLAPCENTRPDCWGIVLGSAHSIVSLWDNYEWKGCANADQQVSVVDTRTGKRMDESEYASLVKRLKGWK